MKKNNRYCALCGSRKNIESHHIFGGALRSKSTKYGLIIDLCHSCHNEPPKGAHHNKDTMLKLHQFGQRKVMSEQNWTVEQFVKEFRKNYL
ncbi:MAG: hypothetical protein ACI4HO_09210 [Ruminococcus sp.]